AHRGRVRRREAARARVAPGVAVPIRRAAGRARPTGITRRGSDIAWYVPGTRTPKQREKGRWREAVSGGFRIHFGLDEQHFGALVARFDLDRRLAPDLRRPAFVKL